MNKALQLLLIFSLAFNIAFVGIWVHNRYLGPPGPSEGPPPGAPPGGGGPPEGPDHAPGTWERLGLSPEQQRRLEEHRRQARKQMQQLQAEAHAERERLWGLLAREPIDEQAVAQSQQRLEEIQKQIGQQALREMLLTHKRLTPEQRKALFRMMRTHRNRGQEGGQWRPRRRPGDQRDTPQGPRPGGAAPRQPEMMPPAP
jgi:Spy/CpxP family protein refolding chaperone